MRHDDTSGKVLRHVGPVRSDFIQFVDGRSEGNDLPGSLRENFEAIKHLDSTLRASRYQPRAVKTPAKFHLMRWVADELVRFRKSEGESSPTVAALEELDKMKTNDRTKHYGKIKGIGLNWIFPQNKRKISSHCCPVKS